MNFDFTTAERGQISVVSTNGKLYMPAQTCKEYVQCTIAHGVNPEYAKDRKLHNAGYEGKISLEKPMFVLWTGLDTAERNATKFMQLMNQIEDIMGLSPSIAYPVTTGIGDKAAPIVAEADYWWMKSPITVDAYFVFLRLSITMLVGEPLDEFITRMVENESHGKYAITRDAGYLRMAKDKGHLTGLLEKSLPCFNREGYGDWLLSRGSRGFSMYDIKKDSKFPLDFASLLKLRMKQA